MKRIETARIFIQSLFSYLLEPFVKIVPRDRHKWLFGSSSGTLKDNPKYLFYWAIENHQEIRAIWIGRNKPEIRRLQRSGYEAYYWLSIKGLFHALTSKVYICDHHLGDINNYLSGGAFFVNLWHGSSVKRVKWQAPEYYVRRYNLKDETEMRTSFIFKILEYPDLFKVPDLCLAPSKIQAEMFFAPMMDIPLSNCVIGVYPRSRLLLCGKETALSFIREHESEETLEFIKKIEEFSKVYIYMPTWRKDGCDFMSQSGISWEQLDVILKKRNELFVVKFHPFTKIDVKELSYCSNIMLYPSSSDIYTVLPFIDCLITDYSSVYTDFLIMNKEVILFTFDYDEYIKDTYELADYDKYFVGKRVSNFENLMQVINDNEDCRVPEEQYKFLMNFFWDDNQYQIDIIEIVKNRLFPPKPVKEGH